MITYGMMAKKYKKHGSFAEQAAVSVFQAEYAFYIACALVLALSFLYVAETNAVMLLERVIPQKESTLMEKEQSVTKLEVAAAQLRSGEQMKEIAQALNMTFSGTVTYVSVNNSSVALAR